MTITDIVARLEEAKGPNYAIEVEIFKLVHPEYAGYVQGRGGLIHPQDGEDVRVQSNVRAPNYTASVDAAIALAGRVLPGWRIITEHGDNYSIAQFKRGWGPARTEYLGLATTERPDNEISLCLVTSILKALTTNPLNGDGVLTAGRE